MEYLFEYGKQRVKSEGCSDTNIRLSLPLQCRMRSDLWSTIVRRFHALSKVHLNADNATTDPQKSAEAACSSSSPL